MPFVTIDGTLIEVPASALFADENQTPLNIPTGPVFTADDLERVRSEEKDKLYGRIDTLTQTISTLNEQVGGLTAEQQREKAAAEQEKARLAEEARRQEEQGLDAQTLIDRARQEWQQTLQEKESEWNNRFTEQEQARQQAEALAAKEREFSTLKDYAQSQVEANKKKIAPQLLAFVGGNSQEEIDASIARAIETTDAIAAEMQQALAATQQQVDPATGQVVTTQQAPAPPATPGTRVTAAPVADPGAQFQQLTKEQIDQMPMDQYVQLRGKLGIGGQSNNRGLFG